MPYDLTIVLNDIPGALAQVGETMGKAGINIEGYWLLLLRRQELPSHTGERDGRRSSSAERSWP